jgi:hypothetical protein
MIDVRGLSENNERRSGDSSSEATIQFLLVRERVFWLGKQDSNYDPMVNSDCVNRKAEEKAPESTKSRRWSRRGIQFEVLRGCPRK